MGRKMAKYNRIIIIIMLIFLAAWLAALAMPAQDIATILQAIATPAGIYVAIKGRGTEL